MILNSFHDVLTTKLFLPQLSHWTLIRQCLIARLNMVLERRLALVCPSAGYGKTTLLASWVAQLQDARVAWVSLDREDNEALNFWHCILCALGR